jgi:phenylacetate-coenzyme A ligase PaaK-like adenylate-forming protein
VHSWLVPRVVFPVYERVTGRRLWTAVRELRDLQWRSPDEVAARAAGRLRALLVHAERHVPYYRRLFQDAGFDPHAVRGAEDLARLPVTTKAALRARPPGDLLADDRPIPRGVAVTTSGATGFPFEIIGDPASADETVAAYLFFLEWAGAALWQTRVDLGVRLGRSFSTAPWLRSRATRAPRRLLLGEDVRSVHGPKVTAEEFHALVAQISVRREYFIRAYPAYAADLGARLVASGLELPAAPRVVISCSETLTAAREAIIKRAFGAPVVNHYSTWEALHLAQSCPDDPAVLHVNPERVVLWVARADGIPASPGETGRLLLTALSNYLQPFVNYDIGDRAALGGRCSCGRGWPTLLGVEGRTSEVLRTPSGRVISAIVLNQLPRLSNGRAPVWEYQVEQRELERVVLRVVPAPGFTDTDRHALREELEACLDDEVTVRLDLVDRIEPDHSGKRAVIVTNV